MTEQEVIEYTITKGFDGEEFDTQAWKERGCLRTDGTYKKLINKLECCFEIVVVEGKGKKKDYILSNPKVKMTPLKDNRKGRLMPRKDENVVLTNYVHTKLLSLQREGKLNRTTYKKLGERLFYGESNKNVLKGSVRFTFTDFLQDKKIPSVWSYTDWYFETRARKEIELALDQLQKQNKIVVEKFWIGNFNQEHAIESNISYLKKLSTEEIKQVEQTISEIVEANDFTYAEYKKQLALAYQSKKLLETQQEVQQHLKWSFGLNYMYEAISIRLIEVEPSKVVKYREAQDTFLRKTLGLVKEKKDSLKYRNAKRKSEKFYYLCVLLYVKAMGTPVDETELANEINWIGASLKEIVESYDQEIPLGFFQADS